MTVSLAELAEKLKALESAVIFCHMRPDGDAIGAAMGLKRLLANCGVKCSVACESAIPRKFDFLPDISAFSAPVDMTAEAFIAVDSSDENRLGKYGDVFMQAKKVKFNIDHHISNTRFADYNFVDDVAASCEIMVRLSEYLGGVNDALTANFLMTGLSSDTGNFAHKNVTADTFRAAAYLAECGADINLVQYNMFKKQSKERARLFGETMSKIRYFAEGKIAMIAVTKEDLSRTGASSDMTEGFIDFPLGIEGVEVAACLLETGSKKFKISLRSKGKANVNEIAAVYGGGGHILASGCMMCGELEEVVDKLRYTIMQHLAD